MRDHDDELIFCDLLQQIHDLHARFTVERAGRLVGEQDVGIVDDCARDGHALHLTAGHLVWRLVKLAAKPDLFQRLDGARAPLLTGDAGERQRELDVGQHALVRDEVVALKDKADGVVAVCVPVAVVVLLGGAAVDDEVAGGIAVQTADDVQQRGLAAAGLAQNRDELALTEGNVDTFERFDLRCAGFVNFGDGFQFQHGWDAPLYGCRAAAQPWIQIIIALGHNDKRRADIRQAAARRFCRILTIYSQTILGNFPASVVETWVNVCYNI